MLTLSPTVRIYLASGITDMRKSFDGLAGLARDGRMKSVIGAEYPLGELPAALDLVGSRHARGKIVIRVP